MFTGLIETVGHVQRTSGDSPRRLTVRSSIPVAEVAIGDSIAIEGCCLTVVQKGHDTMTFEAATETERRTTLGYLHVGSAVNLERALRLGDRLDGHLVSGHVDGTGTVVSREQRGSAVYLGFDAPGEIAPLIASQGAIAVSGVSLTVTRVEGCRFWVAVIPHTLAKTTLDEVVIGDRVNLEADLVARYIERLLASSASAQKASLTPQFLKDKGFL